MSGRQYFSTLHNRGLKIPAFSIRQDWERREDAALRSIIGANNAAKGYIKAAGMASDRSHRDFEITVTDTTGAVIGSCGIRIES